jgi:imidazole glycerol phosphate synthase subunit HisF
VGFVSGFFSAGDTGGVSVAATFLSVLSGASAVAAGAIFQFTQITPKQVRNFLSDQGVQVRVAE